MQVLIYNGVGKLMRMFSATAKQGKNTYTLADLGTWPHDIYTIKLFVENEVFVKKMLLVR